MTLEFHGDAICLSGVTGTKLKTQIISEYYRFWLDVTTRGSIGSVYIVEMDAGTGEIYIEDTHETVLGSAGHVLQLKYGPTGDKYGKLRTILIEKDEKCRHHMDRVIARRWPKARLTHRNGTLESSTDRSVIRFSSSDDFLEWSKSGESLGISLFFFDPLLAPDWELVNGIAKSRIDEPYKMGTEFLIFFFTSDWINGRKEFSPLPKIRNERAWNEEEKKSAEEADRSFGGRAWTEIMHSGGSKAQLEDGLVDLYKAKLRKWFRFVQPLPFVPKGGQRYHVYCCSNYDVGPSVLSRIYESHTRPFGLQAENDATYARFKLAHPHVLEGHTGRSRPAEWKVLWHVMRNHADGLCDEACRELREKKVDNPDELVSVLKWLESEGYIERVSVLKWPWAVTRFPVYQVDWHTVKKKLGIHPPIPPTALEPGEA